MPIDSITNSKSQQMALSISNNKPAPLSNVTVVGEL